MRTEARGPGIALFDLSYMCVRSMTQIFTILHMTVTILWPMTIKVSWVLIWELQINFSNEANLQTQNPWTLRMYYIYYLDICYLTPPPECKFRESRCFYLLCSLLHLRHPEHRRFLTNIGWANKPEVLFWSDTISCIFALFARKVPSLMAKKDFRELSTNALASRMRN